MADQNPKDSEVKIFGPDRSLQAKAGLGNLDRMLSPQAIANAEKLITNSADQFFDEGLASFQQIEKTFDALQKKPADSEQLLSVMINAAFSFKTKMGMGGYDLVAALAKSLQLLCERIKSEKLSDRNIGIILWHVTSIKQLVKNRVKGTGGEAGAAIMAELERLTGKP